MRGTLAAVATLVIGVVIGYSIRGAPDQPPAPAPREIPTSAIVNVTPLPKRILKTGDPFDEINARLRAWAQDVGVDELRDAQIYEAMDRIVEAYGAVGNFPGDWLVKRELFFRRQVLCRHLTPGVSGYCG
jgi:hypothetical protein